MPEPNTTKKETKTRAKRRNFQRELETVRTYVEIRLEIMSATSEGNEPTMYQRGESNALAGVLAKLDGAK